MRILVGIESASAIDAGAAVVCRVVKLGVEHLSNARQRRLLADPRLGGKDASGVAGHVSYQHTPDQGILESAAKRNLQAFVDDNRA
jgi:hypothetical protein